MATQQDTYATRRLSYGLFRLRFRLRLRSGWWASLLRRSFASIELKRAVEAQHGCPATLVESVLVKETFEGKTVWEGIVHLFKLTGHPKTDRAYAW